MYNRNHTYLIHTVQNKYNQCYVENINIVSCTQIF